MNENTLKSISNEEIRELPGGKYKGEVVLLKNKNEAEKAIEEIRSCQVLGMDTETKPAFRKGVFNPVALVQIATDKKVYLFRVLKTGPLPGLAKLLEDKSTVKVGIAIGDDLKDLKKEIPFRENNVVDLNIMAQQNGFVSIGAKKLSALVLGIRISKGQQVSNWENKELSRAQIDYAATDAWLCREIYIRFAKYYKF